MEGGRLHLTLQAAARGRYPAWDGETEVIPPPAGAAAGIFTFTGHNMVAAAMDQEFVHHHCPTWDLPAPLRGPFLSEIGRVSGAEQGPLDLVLVARGSGGRVGLPLNEVENDVEHPRLRRAFRVRTHVRAFEITGGSGILAVGRGIEGRWEAGFEVAPEARGKGLGRALASAARSFVPAGDHLFLQVAAGNVASLRAVLGAGFTPIGAEILFGAGANLPRSLAVHPDVRL